MTKRRKWGEGEMACRGGSTAVGTTLSSASGLFLILLLCADPAWAASCNVLAQNVSFGHYDPLRNAPLDSAGNISVSCDASTGYALSLSPGHGSYAARTMTSGSNTLSYNLYTNASRTIIWGDGTGGSSIVTASGPDGNHPVYGRIPAGQNVRVGTYADIITVTLNF